MKIPRVMLIGGAPFVGKSSAARCIAARYEYGCISTDDIGRAIGSVCPETDLTPVVDWRNYFTRTPVELLLEHAANTRRRIWPAVEKIVRTHAKWADPLVLEGYGLWPETVMGAEFSNTSAVFLICNERVLELRIRSQPDFYQGAEDVEAFIQNFSLRSKCYNELMLQSAARCNAKVITVVATHTIEDIVDLCIVALTDEES